MSFILPVVGSHPGTGAAGASAEIGYKAALRARRRSGAACAAFAAAAVAVRPRPDPRRWLRGAAGERATAELLERLPARRFAVLHDLAVPGSRANVDHLVIGPTGVWVIDTKTTTAPVTVRRRSVHLGGRRLDTAPARWEAHVVADRLGVDVRVVVAVHGGGLRRRGVRRRGVLVLPASRVVRRLRRGGLGGLGGGRLQPAEVAALADLARATFEPAVQSGRTHGKRRGPHG